MEAGCENGDSLWICLICANIGCGRYVDGHAYRHFLDTQVCMHMHVCMYVIEVSIFCVVIASCNALLHFFFLLVISSFC